jgi:drug/metabolite transporter (DMT)-like permease
VYGTSIVVQHRASHTGREEDARHLMSLLRNPIWLVAIAGDFVGFLLNIAALSTGPVVVIQPLVVLMLPVALVVSWRLGGPRPRVGEGLGSAGIIVGLGCVLALVGDPGEGHTPRARYVALAIVIVLIVGVALSLSVIKRGATLRGAVYGIAAGIYFGTLGVMVDGASNVVVHRGVAGLFTSWRGLVPLIGIVVLGTGGIILTQVSFQIGHLAATLPANLAADPFTAVLIGALLLREHIPLSPWHLFGYAGCLALVIAGAMRLARRAEEPTPVVDAAARMGG